jgi:hypothetical protein
MMTKARNEELNLLQAAGPHTSRVVARATNRGWRSVGHCDKRTLLRCLLQTDRGGDQLLRDGGPTPDRRLLRQVLDRYVDGRRILGLRSNRYKRQRDDEGNCGFRS